MGQDDDECLKGIRRRKSRRNRIDGDDPGFEGEEQEQRLA